MTTRFVITHINREGIRILSTPQQGRWTYPDLSTVTMAIDAMMANNSEATLKQVHGPQCIGTFAPRPCECYEGHHDPRRCVWLDECKGMLTSNSDIDDNKYVLTIGDKDHEVSTRVWGPDAWPDDAITALEDGKGVPVIACPASTVYDGSYEICEFLPA